MNETAAPAHGAHRPTPPSPRTVSAQAREALQRLSLSSAPEDLQAHRATCARVQLDLGAVQIARHGVHMRDTAMDGVPVRIFSPATIPEANRQHVLLNLHGGGFIVDAGSITENVPVAAYARMTVVAARYRLAPEHPFPAAVDDAERVYRHLVTRHGPARIGLYGTSAGACLCAQLIVRLRETGLPLPRVFGFFTGTADLSRNGDSEFFFRGGLDGQEPDSPFPEYVTQSDRLSSQVSPIFADLTGLPPTLCIAGTRDFMLSQTSLFHRALLHSGVDARLLLFEAMPHAHWIFLDLPESDEAFGAMAAFLSGHLTSALPPATSQV